MRIIFLLIFLLLFPAVSYSQPSILSDSEKYNPGTITDDVVVARVNGNAITLRDLEAEIDRLIPQITFHRNVSEEKRKTFREKAFEELINRELEYQDAAAKGMKPDKERVNAQMEQIRKRSGSKKEYEAALKQAGITEDELRRRVEKDILIQTVIAKMVTEPAQMDEAALKDYYDKTTTKFKQPESVKLRLISTKDEKKAMEILAKVRAGEDFGDLAAKMSEDSYRVKGGDIGYIHKGRMLPELEDAAFKLKVGEVSGLIKAENAWFIIKVEDKKPEHQLSFEESKDKLKKDLEAKRARELKEKWIADLRAKAKIEVLLKTESVP